MSEANFHPIIWANNRSAANLDRNTRMLSNKTHNEKSTHDNKMERAKIILFLLNYRTKRLRRNK